MSFEVTHVRTPEEIAAALAVRKRVFVEEQQVPIDEEIDRYDDQPWTRNDVVHVIGTLDGAVIATARLLLDTSAGGYPHIARVAVLQEQRGRGYGRGVMLALQDDARARGFAGVTLGAQLHAIPFYERLGYIARGPVFLDAGIEHRDMDLVFEGVSRR